MWTGPGRPSRASLNALGMILARSSTLWAWKLRLVIGLTTLGKSAEKWRYSSCSAPLSNWLVATWPVIATNDDESANALPIATVSSIGPGPVDV
jgi:hypothetical protein